MGKIVSEKSGDLRTGIFYRFGVQDDDDRPSGEGFIVAERVYRGDEPTTLPDRWMSIHDLPETLIETKDCPVDGTHVTRISYDNFRGRTDVGRRVTPFIPTKYQSCFALSDELYHRIKALQVREAQLDPFTLVWGETNEKITGIWACQFTGKAALRLPKFVDVANQCPHCGRGTIMCPSCGFWGGYCKICNRPMVIVERMHGGKNDKQIPIEDGLWRIIEGSTWDGSDLIKANWAPFASKRFIDWLLRIHAAPFHAEPVWFCVDGMNDQQKRWFDELQKPFEA